MCKKSNYIVIGSAPNFNELIESESIYARLSELSKTHTIVGLNGALLDDNLRDYLDIIITIDFYTWDYLVRYPELQHKMYVDKTVKKYFDRHNVLQEVTNVFQVDNSIQTENNGKLFLNRYAPTVLHTALNLCLVKALENNCLDTTRVTLWGIQLSEEWGHCRDEGSYAKQATKDAKTVNGMRESTYLFKRYYDLRTLNKQHTLDIKNISYNELLKVKF